MTLCARLAVLEARWRPGRDQSSFLDTELTGAHDPTKASANATKNLMTMSRTQATRPESNLEVEHWYLQRTLWYKRIRARFAGVVTRNSSTSKTQGLLGDVNRIRVLSIWKRWYRWCHLDPSGAYSICIGWLYIVPLILCSLSWPSCRDESHDAMTVMAWLGQSSYLC